MTRIHISADSTSDLSDEIISKYGISIIPLCIVNDGVSKLDGVEINSSDVFEIFDQTGKICSTAAVNQFDFQSRFSEMLETSDYVIHISISSEMSVCYQNALNAAEEFHGKVYVVDGRNLSTGTGHLVYAAAEMAEQGMDVCEIVDKLRAMALKVEASFVVDTMEYLKRGGRCSALQAFGASVLKIKPCIEVIGGKMTVGTTYRGSYEKCLKKYVKERLEGRTDIDFKRIFITYSSSSPEIATMVREQIAEFAAQPFEEIIETTASCTISCHCGPNTLGILFIRK